MVDSVKEASEDNQKSGRIPSTIYRLLPIILSTLLDYCASFFSSYSNSQERHISLHSPQAAPGEVLLWSCGQLSISSRCLSICCQRTGATIPVGRISLPKSEARRCELLKAVNPGGTCKRKKSPGDWTFCEKWSGRASLQKCLYPRAPDEKFVCTNRGN